MEDRKIKPQHVWGFIQASPPVAGVREAAAKEKFFYEKCKQ